MKLRSIAALGLALGLSAAAHAQFSIYGTYQANRFTGVSCLDTRGCATGTAYNQQGSVNNTGGWGGVSYNWKKYGPALIGFDLRGGEGHGNKSGTSNAGGQGTATTQGVLGGVKATFKTPIRVVKPYAQVSLGWGRSNVTEPVGATNGSLSPVAPQRYDSFLAVQGFIGADIRIFPVLDLRIVELGIGNMSRTGSGTGSSNIGVQSAGIGVVFHLPASN